MRPPLSFAYGNVLFGSGLDDAWGLYRLATRSYDGLSVREKRELLGELAAFAYGIGADFSLLRVTRPWTADAYLAAAELTVDARHCHRERWLDQVELHRQLVHQGRPTEPEVYLSIRLSDSRRPVGQGRQLRDLAHGLEWLGLRHPAGISGRRLERLLAEEEATFRRVCDYLDADRAASHELQWLGRRALCRGLGEPWIDERFLPQALVLEDEQGERSYQPLECDLLRLGEARIHHAARGLRVESELGDSHQTLLVLGALPETTSFPGPQAELLFWPLEAVDFPVDAAFSCRWIGNERAVALVRRRVVDADNIYAEEASGDHGPSPQAADRPAEARELEDYLTGSSRPPLLRASISLAVGAASAGQLEQRVERLRREYGGVRLHRPLGEQLRLFVQHLPAQASQVPDYDDYLLVEQLGAMVPTATRAVGSSAGPYIGHTTGGAPRPVLLDLSEASRTARPPSMLLAGTLGSGKTLLLELLLYHAFLQGSRIVDVDPKGDHRLHRLPGVEGHAELIELSGDRRFQGLLDPLRIAPKGTAEELATSFLVAVLPDPDGAERTAIRAAVKATLAAAPEARASCGQVLEALAQGDPGAQRTGRELAVYADTGLARLGFSDSSAPPPAAGQAQLVSLRIRNLPRPLPGTARGELSEEERIGQAVLRLVCAYAMHMMGDDPGRHKALGLDEAWFLLQDSAGQRLIEQLNRWGRSEFATPILVTHLLSDAEALDNLIGARFIFGMESEHEADKALRLLRLDHTDERRRQRLLAYRRGRCLMRDYEGRSCEIQIDLADPRLLAQLDTTPRPVPAPARDANATEPG